MWLQDRTCITSALITKDSNHTHHTNQISKPIKGRANAKTLLLHYHIYSTRYNYSMPMKPLKDYLPNLRPGWG